MHLLGVVGEGEELGNFCASPDNESFLVVHGFAAVAAIVFRLPVLVLLSDLGQRLLQVSGFQRVLACQFLNICTGNKSLLSGSCQNDHFNRLIGCDLIERIVDHPNRCVIECIHLFLSIDGDRSDP